MRVTGPGSIGNSNDVKKKKKSQSADGSFSTLLEGEDATPTQSGGASGVGPVAPIDGILATQVVSDESPAQQYINHGKALLDKLDDIRHGLLMGEVSAEAAYQLMQEIRQNRGEISDPKLKEIIDDIELRAKVELAKLGR